MQIHSTPHAGALRLPIRGLASAEIDPEAEPGQNNAGLRLVDPMPDDDFVFLQQTYRPSGGLANGDELATRLNVGGAGGFARLARWIVGRQLFSFAWHDRFWLPMFQFEVLELVPRPGLHAVLAELVDVMDGRALADWFAQPNDLLNGSSPAARLVSHGPAVQQAARLQRYVTRG